MIETNTNTAETSDIPIACNLSEVGRNLRGDEVRNIFSDCERVEELADGYAFLFPGDDEWAATLFKFVTEERQCCPFFTFDLVFEPGPGAIRLQLRGDDRVKLFTRESFVASLPHLAPAISNPR